MLKSCLDMTMNQTIESSEAGWQVCLRKSLSSDIQNERWLGDTFELLCRQQETDMKKEAIEAIAQCPETLMKLDCPLDKQAIEDTLEHEQVDHAYFIMKSGLLCPKNQAKNRYQNVLPWDRTRVILKRTCDSGHKTDYINANHIHINRYSKVPLTEFQSHPVFELPHQIPYIATQAPMECSEADFYQMVWEQGSHVIITLANTVEAGRIKGFPYWEQSKQLMEYHPISPTSRTSRSSRTTRQVDMVSCASPLSVVLVSESIPFPGCVYRELQLTCHTDPLVQHDRRKVVQIHYTQWPDFGVAPVNDLLNIINLARRYYDKPVEAYQDTDPVQVTKGPMVTHCSAGIGRTGVFIAVDAILRCLQAHTPCTTTPPSSCLDLVCWVVVQLRRQRCGMVQTPEQLACIYNTIISVYHQQV